MYPPAVDVMFLYFPVFVLFSFVPITFGHTAACRRSALTLIAAIHFAVKRAAPRSAGKRHSLSFWAAVVQWSTLMPKALRSSRKHPIHSFSCPSHPFFYLPQVHQSVHDVFVRLQPRVGHVYNRRQDDVEQGGRKHAPLAKILFHSEPPRAHHVVEPHAYSYAIVDLTNDRD